MRSTPRRLNSFNGVAWGERPNVKLDPGPTYDKLVLETNITDPADIARVAVNLNGDEIYVLTGQDLVMLEQYKKHYTVPGIYVIPFADDSNKAYDGQTFTSLVTLPTDNVTVHVELKAKPAGTAAPQITGWSFTSAARADRYWLPRIRTQIMQASVAGENEHTTLDKGPAIRRMHLKNGDIKRVEFERNFLKVFDMSTTANDFILARADRAPQDGYFHFDPLHTGFGILDRFVTRNAQQLLLRVNVGTPGPIPILVETIEQIKMPPEAAAAAAKAA